jgi:hypothetical protein
MADRPIDLDARRGMAAQVATERRRLESGFAAEHAKLKARQEELERFMLAAPAAGWAEAADKAKYLLTLFGATSEGQDPRRSKLIANLVADFDRLLELRAENQPALERKQGQMAKGQKRSGKEPRKAKSTEKKAAGPKYLRPSDLGQKGGSAPAGRKP